MITLYKVSWVHNTDYVIICLFLLMANWIQHVTMIEQSSRSELTKLNLKSVCKADIYKMTNINTDTK